MDLSRRRFLGMLGLAPVIPLVAPTKAYSFLGNILRPRLIVPELPVYVVDFARFNIDGKPEPLYATRPGIDQPMVFRADELPGDELHVADVLRRLGIEDVKATGSQYRLNYTKTLGGITTRISEAGAADCEGLLEMLYWEGVEKTEILPEQLFTPEALRGKERPIG